MRTLRGPVLLHPYMVWFPDGLRGSELDGECRRCRKVDRSALVEWKQGIKLPYTYNSSSGFMITTYRLRRDTPCSIYQTPNIYCGGLLLDSL